MYFIHSRRWRENHDAAIKAFLAREGTSLEVFLPDLENHELMFSLEKHFDDGPLIPALVMDAYRYFARLAREFSKPTEIWLFGRYPTYTFYRFDRRAIVALYSNTAAKKHLPAFEITTEGLFGEFLASDIEDLKRECRRRTPRSWRWLFTIRRASSDRSAASRGRLETAPPIPAPVSARSPPPAAPTRARPGRP